MTNGCSIRRRKDNPTDKPKKKHKGNGKAASLLFGAACTSNAACASGICGCLRADCVGGGLCVDACVFEPCSAKDGGLGNVFTPGGGSPGVCLEECFPSCDACNSGETCPGGTVCSVGAPCHTPIDL
jgi:hypothetical protein